MSRDDSTVRAARLLCVLVATVLSAARAQPDSGRPPTPDRPVRSPIHRPRAPALPPRIDSVVPDAAYPGDVLTLTVFGANLIPDSLPATGIDAPAAAPPQVHVGNTIRAPLAVLPNGYLQARLRIPQGETPGPRDVSVVWGGRPVAERRRAFTVLERPLPDWRLHSPTVSVASDRRSVSATVIVGNTSRATAPATVLKFWLKSVGDTFRVDVPSLRPGAARPFNHMLPLSSDADGATDTVFFEVVAPETAGERRRDDNRASRAFEVAADQPARGPDLTVIGIEERQTERHGMLFLVISAQVANVGDQASGPAALAIACQSPGWETADGEVSALPPGRSTAVSVELPVPPALRGTTVRFRVEVLANDADVENNGLGQEVLLRPAVTPGHEDLNLLPNLSLSDPGWSFDPKTGRLTCWVEAANLGDNTSGRTRLVLTLAGTEVTRDAGIQALVPGTSCPCTLAVEVPEDLRRAGFEFVLRVDPDDEVAESDENDNTISTRVPLPPVRRPFPVAVPIAAGGVVAAAAIGWAVARLLAGARAAPGPAAEPRSADVKSAEPPGEEMKSAEPPEPREASAGELPKGAVAGTYGGKRARDDVYFTVTSPAEVAPRASLVVNVWAHVDAQRDEVLKRARQAEPGPEPLARSKGPFGIARDTELDVLLTIEDCTVESDKDTIRWTGAIANADFLVRVSDRAAEGNKAGCASVLYRGLEVARVRFLLKVTTAPAAARAEATGRPHRKAFASYARADAHDVLTCIQGMEKALPDLKVFVDVLRFRSGQYWQTTLQQEIMASDVFYLFWSKAARDSEWVNKEWRYGFDQKGLDFIDPVPLVSPREVPPPPELADRHFDDWELAFKSYLGKPAGPP